MARIDPPSEEEVKRAAEIREWLGEKIAELEIELGRLKDMQALVDSVLRKSSFVPATELRTSAAPAAVRPAQAEKESSHQSKSAAQSPPPETSEESRQLRRSKDGMLLANAFITRERVVVVPTSEVKVSQTTPPFQTFFVNRILKGYEAKDKELSQSGKLKNAEVLTYAVEESEGYISKVTVSNYRDKARLNEILSTINWALTRMLEKK